MDKNQLVTVIVTIVITAVIKEVVTWLVALAKKMAPMETIKAKLKIMFNKTNRTIFGDVLALMFYLVVLVYVVADPSPLTKAGVLIIVGLVIGALVMAGSLLVHIAIAVGKKDKKELGPSAANDVP